MSFMGVMSESLCCLLVYNLWCLGFELSLNFLLYRHCTYCVVPSVRGVEQSRSMEAILQECKSLASSGYKEVTLLGQNIDAYGRDMTPKRTFADLLHYLNDNLPDGTIERIRYVTR